MSEHLLEQIPMRRIEIKNNINNCGTILYLELTNKDIETLQNTFKLIDVKIELQKE